MSSELISSQNLKTKPENYKVFLNNSITVSTGAFDLLMKRSIKYIDLEAKFKKQTELLDRYITYNYNSDLNLQKSNVRLVYLHSKLEEKNKELLLESKNNKKNWYYLGTGIFVGFLIKCLF